MRGVAIVLSAALLSGCFGYNSSSKKWAYAGNTLLMLGGGAAIAADVLTHETKMCPSPPVQGIYCNDFSTPFGGAAVAGTLLVTAGIVGIIINATRPTVKTTR